MDNAYVKFPMIPKINSPGERPQHLVSKFFTDHVLVVNSPLCRSCQIIITHIFGVHVSSLAESNQYDIQFNVRKNLLTVQHRAGVTHHLTLPLHDLFGPSFVINPLNFFTDGPGHNAGHNEAVDYADVFQYVAFQGTFLFRFF
jgi:hypothetical protein